MHVKEGFGQVTGAVWTHDDACGQQLDLTATPMILDLPKLGNMFRRDAIAPGSLSEIS
jgi:hypothetical protein